MQSMGTAWGTLGLISGEEARNIQGSLNQYGYQTNMGRGKRLYDMATNLRYRTGLDTGFITEVLDTTQRFSPEKLKSVNKTLEEMGASAKQARMGLDAFASGVLQGAAQISQATGASTPDAMKAAMQYGAATGANPNTVGTIMTPKNWTYWMTLRKNKGDYVKTATDVGGRMEAGLQIAGGLDKGLTKEAFLDKNRKGEVMQSLYKLHQLFPSVYAQTFGGLDPTQAYNMMRRTKGDISGAMGAMDRLKTAAEGGRGLSAAQLRKTINMSGLEGKTRRELLDMVKNKDAAATKEIAKKMNLIGKGQPKVTIELKGAAKKFFKFSNEATKGKHGFLAEVAVESGEGAAYGAAIGSIVPGVGTGLGAGIGAVAGATHSVFD
jgi:hypothetical protein